MGDLREQLGEQKDTERSERIKRIICRLVKEMRPRRRDGVIKKQHKIGEEIFQTMIIRKNG